MLRYVLYLAGFYGSGIAEDLRARYGGVLDAPATSIYEFGFDGVQPFTFRIWSTNIVTVRYITINLSRLLVSWPWG